VKEIRTKITEGGGIMVPAEYWQELSLQPGDEVVIRLEESELRIFTLRSALKRAQDLVGRYVSADRSLADELIAGRRQERDV
jgi:bifunctional DNA-binding transcriptional regulator/antitoxin component of YhaV-PrlF toxin-antitoxin module